MIRLFTIHIALFLALSLCGQNMPMFCETEIKETKRLEKFQDQQSSYGISQKMHYDFNTEKVTTRVDVIIPVVFHVIWASNEDNLTDDIIISQLDALNAAFTGQNEGRNYIPNLFLPTIGNPEMAFCLANQDENGLAHSGINRIQTEISFIGDAETLDGKPRIKYTQLGGHDAWDPNKYINVWIGKKELGLAEASFPGSNIEIEQGIIIDPAVVGGSEFQGSNPDYNLGHVLIHEMGHYFGLTHLFGDETNCDSDDGIPDTPNQSIQYAGCPDFPQLSCNSSDMFMNFMALTNDRCTKFFTNNQSAAMNATLLFDRHLLMSSSCVPSGLDIALEEKVSISFLTGQDLIQLELDLESNEQLEISIYDLQGRLLFYREISFQSYYEIDINELASGIYLLYLNMDSENKVEKFLKP